ncbi:hypothetical protein [Bradyrhizobium sp.]|uniref:hypothetical protein n=1 Tax=Bradyrhizobium sp. TaxID=376 RepID=UPI0025C036ED|nr:hypothetical protein [Bradyrhizobium sp.]
MIARQSVLAAVLTATATLSLATAANAENQPHMRAALASLQNARAQLQTATPDKGGHRVKAIDLVNAAIAEVQRGIAFDNRN